MIRKHILFIYAFLTFFKLNALAQVSNVEGLIPLEGVIMPQVIQQQAVNPYVVSKDCDGCSSMDIILPKLIDNSQVEYPSKSVRAGEQGTVLISVFISTEGIPLKVVLNTSSGFANLDKTAMAAVMGYRYTPAKRGGITEAMWYLQRMTFKLQD